MNKSTLKTYAPQARRDFIDMVTSRAAQLGIAEHNGELKVESSLVQGEVVVIAGQAFPVNIERLRKKLLERIRQQGFSQTMEAIAYTWFNRFAALRYMELHEYLEHGQRVLSSVSVGGLPDILTHALDLAEAGELPAISRDMVAELKLNNKDGELYKRLLVAQCNKLATAMPFLFEKIDDDTELLLPDTLLRTDSVIRKLVDGIAEEDWQQVEVIGWLYQFYISEKKDQVIGKVVKSEDIPAATQLFTPNWIVKYLVQNSVGHLWLMANPHSGLAAQMAYYIQPAEQTAEVQAQLDALIRARCTEGVRGEGIGDIVEEIENERDQELSGFNRVAKSDGLGGNGLSSNASISKGGVIWPYQPTTASCGVDSVQLGGGTRPQVESGVSEFCVDSAGITSGSRNADYDSHASKLHSSQSSTANTTFTSGNWQNAQHPKNSPFREQGLETKVQGLGLCDSSTLPPTLYSLTSIPYPLSPESITVLDPACGSGHILVEAYDLLKEIYLERGYKQRDIPRLILKHNLFGLDIDDRAAQLAGFALLMKARADDRRLFDNTPVLNVLAIQNSQGLDDELMADVVMQAAVKLERGEVLGNRDLFGGGALATEHSSGLKAADLRELIRFFECGKTFGSLLTVSETLAEKLPKLEVLLAQVIKSGDSLAKSYAVQIWGDYLQPALVLAQRYDAVVANPPYMGNNGMNDDLKKFAKLKKFKGKSDLMTLFLENNLTLTKDFGFSSTITLDSWMFLSSFTELRDFLLTEKTIENLVHIGWNCFPEVHTYLRGVACTFCNTKAIKNGKYLNLSHVPATTNKQEMLLDSLANNLNMHEKTQDDFKKIPASPIAYWVSERTIESFDESVKMGDFCTAKQGLATANNDIFVRSWSEVGFDNIGFNCESLSEAKNTLKKWFPYNKGGEFRRWYGNSDFVVNWEDDGAEIKNFCDENGKQRSRPQNTQCYFKESISWSDVTSGITSFRYFQRGYIYDVTGMSAQSKDSDVLKKSLLFCNTKFVGWMVKTLNPTLHFQIGNYSNLPLLKNIIDKIDPATADKFINLSSQDWDAYERSWDFTRLPILSTPHQQTTLAASYTTTRAHWQHITLEMQRLEQENNRIFINAYGLQDELTPEVPLKEITLTCNPHYRYGGDNSPEQLEQRLQTDTCKELVSYAIGNMMGRYSLNRDGLVYAHAGNQGFNELVQAGAYQRFAADADGILPITDISWFADDAANRIKEFLIAVWGGKGVRDQGSGIEEQGLATIGQQCESANSPLPPKPYSLNNDLLWLADSLGRKPDETPEEAIRRYLVSSFYKDHLQTYKKRPIYWLFSSGKHKAFEALVYLHRYNEGTLSRMRTEYVVPLTGKMNDRIRFLETEVPKATSTAERKKLEKDIDRLKKKLDELRLYDEKLRHYADRRIALDLDDGVKVNYGKFGDLLAEVKAVTGGSDE